VSKLQFFTFIIIITHFESWWRLIIAVRTEAWRLWHCNKGVQLVPKDYITAAFMIDTTAHGRISLTVEFDPMALLEQHICLVTVCRWLLFLVAVNCVLLTPTNCLLFEHLHLLSGHDHSRSLCRCLASQAPRPWSVTWVSCSKTALFSVDWFVNCHAHHCDSSC